FDAPPHWPRAAAGWAALVAIALVSTVAAMLAFFAGLARLGAARTSMLSTLEPVVTVALAAELFGETLTPLQWAGGVAILAAVLWLVRAGDAADSRGAGDDRERRRLGRRDDEPSAPGGSGAGGGLAGFVDPNECGIRRVRSADENARPM
ncbi:EamA family transporter, partial [Burkholderia pseudomallei]